MPPPVARPGCQCADPSCAHCGRRNPYSAGTGRTFYAVFFDPFGCTCPPSSRCAHCWPDRAPLNEVDELASQRLTQPMEDLRRRLDQPPAVRPVVRHVDPLPATPGEESTSTPAPPLPATCQHCGKRHSGFSDDGKNQPKKYCSMKCRYDAGNARKRARQRAVQPAPRPDLTPPVKSNPLGTITIPEK